MAGAGGFYLRLMELWNVFDRRTGLPERGSVITLALIALSVTFLLIALIFSLRAAVKHKAQDGFENAFGTDPLSYPLIFSMIGLVWLGATVKHFIDLRTAGALTQGEVAFSILSLLAAVSLVFFSIEMYQDPRRKTTFALSLVPTLFLCFWLVLMYRRNATNPVLLSYCYQSLAIISAALSFYFTSGFIYKKPAPGKAIFAYLAAIYFCFITLADNHSLNVRLIFAAIIAVNMVHASMLIRNLQWKEAGSV